MWYCRAGAWLCNKVGRKSLGLEMKKFMFFSVLFAVLVLGCENREGTADSGWDAGQVPDADGGSEQGSDGHDGIADQGPGARWRVGSEQTLDVVTWNIRNFPTNDHTPSYVAELIEGLDVDLIAVQEITDVYEFGKILSALDGYTAVLSDDEYGSGEYQKTGLIYKSGMIHISGTKSLFEDDWWSFPRPPLQAELTITRPDGSLWTMIVIVVHLKASVGEENESRRRSACDKIKQYVDGLVSGEIESEVLVLGDFNDQLTDPPSNNVFTPFLDEPDHYEFLTEALTGGQYSYIPARVLIDHMMITGALFDDFQQAQVEPVPMEGLVDDFDYLDNVSDHRPVAAVVPW